MLTKRFIVIAIFFISLVAVSTVSAAEDTGNIAAIESDIQTNEITSDIATDGIHEDALKVSENDESEDELATSEDMEILTGGQNCYVNSSYVGESAGTEDHPYTNLDQALENREDGDIIHIAAGEYTGYGNIGLFIEKKLTLTNWGPGEVIFDAQKEGNIFRINVDEINITGITFKNGMSEDENDECGGALYFVNGMKNSFIGGAFLDNVANSFGGAIFVNEYIENSLISAYFASNSAFMGGAIFANNISNTLIDGDFFNNTAVIGGAINAPIIRYSNITECEFANNTALIGGAITSAIVNNTVIRSEFIGNTADFALGNDDEVKAYVLEYINSLLEEFISDTTVIEKIEQYIEKHNMTLGFGGAISVVGVLENSNIISEFTENNGAVAGGAVCVLGLAIKDGILGEFTHNNAILGGSLWLPIVEYSTIGGEFKDNYAVQGGAIFADIAKNDIINGSFMNNLAINNEDRIGADKLAWGGAICIDGILQDSFIEGYYILNSATELGGAIGGIDFVINSTISGFFSNNTAKIGGAIDAPSLDSSNISGNFAYNKAAIGGAIMALNVNNAQINANFINNAALDYDGEQIGYKEFTIPAGLGGSICIVGNLENSIFAGDFVFNKANAGGAVFIYGLELFESENGIYNNIFDSNFIGNGAGLGAAILINGSSSQNKFNSNFISNVAVLDGIVYLFDSTEDSISGCLFMDNTAENSVLSIESSSGTNITNNIFLNSDRVYDIVVNGELLCLDNNWFGHNATNYEDSPKVDGSELNNWLFLNAVADPASVSYLGTTNIIFNLFVYDNSTKSSVGKYDHTLLEPVNLTIASTNGKVDREIVTFGEAIKFSSNGKKGTVTAAIGDVQDTIEISCLPRLSGNDLVMDYLGNNYKIQVFDTNGNPAAGETVKMTVNGVTYTVKSDKNGYATLPIKLMPKTYTVTSTYKGATNKNTLKVKNTLKAKKSFTVKKTAKKLVLKATLKWSNGKAIAGKKVSFKIKGKKFTVKTNKNGIAKITLSVKILSKKTIKLTFKKKSVALKVGKTYKMPVAYKNETVSSKLAIVK